MTWNRREFLSAVVGLGLTGAGAPASAEGVESESLFGGYEGPKSGFSILQGMTDETTAQFTAVLPKAQAWTIEITDGFANVMPLDRAPQVITQTYCEFALYKFSVSNLRLGVPFTLRVKDEAGALCDERGFRALDLASRSVRLAFVSCQLDFLHHDDIWNKLAGLSADLVFFIGDNVYADRTGLLTQRSADRRQLWERYVATRTRVLYYYQKNLTPTLATWDDHDFGLNNADRTFPYAQDAAEIFELFFAQEDRAALVRGPGIARRFDAFGGTFFLFDDRSFRDVPGDAKAGRMLGTEQEAWFFGASLLAGQPTLLINGSVFYGAYENGESFEGQYADDFAAFVARLKASDATYAFVSGDLHYSELMAIEAEQLGYATFEIVSSGIHSYTFPYQQYRFCNPRRLMSTSAHNFVVFEGSFQPGRIAGAATSYSAGKTEFTSSVSVERRPTEKSGEERRTSGESDAFVQKSPLAESDRS